MLTFDKYYISTYNKGGRGLENDNFCLLFLLYLWLHRGEEVKNVWKCAYVIYERLQSQGQFLTQKPIADTQSTQQTQETQQKEEQGEEESQLIVESTPDTVIMTQNQSSQSQMLSQTDFQSSANTLTGKFYLDFWWCLQDLNCQLC